MTREIKWHICKKCGKPFAYAERSYQLKGEKGEDRPERCEECREEHGREIREVKIPYSRSKPKVISERVFDFLRSGYTFHGERELKSEIKIVDWSGMKVSIAPKDIEEFYQKLQKNQVVVVVGQTGSGKSTMIPYHLLEPPEGYEGDFTDWISHQGQIIVTQPLIAATEFISQTIAEKSGYSPPGKGQIIGYRHGSEAGREGEKLDDWNLLGFATDGSLRNWLREGKIGQYSVIMVDEAHQRTLNIDSLLMFLKNELPKNPSLRAIISSATINAEEFLKAFEKEGISAALFEIPAIKQEKIYVHYWKDEKPVEGCNCWLCQNSAKRKEFWQTKEDPPKEYELPEIITNFVLRILEETQEGSILVFLHGEAAIENSARRIRELKKRIDPQNKIPVIPVYRRLGAREVERRFKQKGEKRRVIVATNIAETSHTLDDVVYVIDSGYIKESEWDPETQISTLPSQHHSQDGCRQRWGRVGRVRDGYVYCLYTREQFEQFNAHTPPEIVRSNLEEVFLTLKAAGLTEIERLPWIESAEEV
jgi:HrpA-like RNA helicase